MQFQEDNYNFKKSKKHYQEKEEKIIKKRFKSKNYDYFNDGFEEADLDSFYSEYDQEN